METFIQLKDELTSLVNDWEHKLLDLNEEVISAKMNGQNRSIKQIVGHMVDSASNNKHRIIHMQYQGSPLDFPDYANNGNNDKWIAIQDFQSEDWYSLVQLWKFLHLHLVHIISKVDGSCLQNVWVSGLEENISMEEMILDFPRHFKLHISEIEELLEEEE